MMYNIEKGREEGLEEGRNEGQEQERHRIVLSMLQKGFPYETISQITAFRLKKSQPSPNRKRGQSKNNIPQQNRTATHSRCPVFSFLIYHECSRSIRLNPVPSFQEPAVP